MFIVVFRNVVSDIIGNFRDIFHVAAGMSFSSDDLFGHLRNIGVAKVVLVVFGCREHQHWDALVLVSGVECCHEARVAAIGAFSVGKVVQGFCYLFLPGHLECNSPHSSLEKRMRK